MPVLETKALKKRVVPALGEAVARAEDTAIDLSTNRVYRLRVRHPYLYGLAAFILGGGFVSVFTMSTYADMTYESVNLAKALYQTVFGGLGGGVASVILAFAYAASIRQTLVPTNSIGRGEAPDKHRER